ncbi:hypothetical protein [Methylomonas sp. CM2]|uniref:hypothetical protein n=1 Tax=Methylomonas sp. CM2 TaxID=3417647 RepID=UPI003CEB34D7
MQNVKPIPPNLPRAGLLRWEIGFALLIKLLFLIGLWFLLFRWLDRPAGPPDIAARLALPAATPATLSTTTVKESNHVR